MQESGTFKITSEGCNNLPLIYILLAVISAVILLVISLLVAGVLS